MFARGRFGEVKRCRERSTGREFAAKFIATREPRDRQDAVHEVDVMLKLRHCRRLVQLYDVFETTNTTCLVLEMYVHWVARYGQPTWAPCRSQVRCNSRTCRDPAVPVGLFPPNPTSANF